MNIRISLVVTALPDDYYQYDFIAATKVKLDSCFQRLYSLETSRISVRLTTGNGYSYANYGDYSAGYDGIEKYVFMVNLFV